MSLYDKQRVWEGRLLTTKAGGTVHLVDPDLSAGLHVTVCNHTIGKNWLWLDGPVARHRTCQACTDLDEETT